MQAFIDRQGVWKRNVPWVKNGKARTDIPTTVLNDTDFRRALYQFPDGSIVSVLAEDLRYALRNAPTRRSGTIIGPFNIDLEDGTIFEAKVPLTSSSVIDVDPDEALIKQLERDLADEGTFNLTSLEDARTTTLRALIQRRGQALFRATLLEAYDYKCAISECDVEEALEAAHIVPYKGDCTNHVQNGIIMRADLHVLFDLYLIGFDPDTLEILVSNKIIKTEYAHLLVGRKLCVPTNQLKRPSRDALLFHFSEMKIREAKN